MDQMRLQLGMQDVMVCYVIMQISREKAELEMKASLIVWLVS